MEFRVLGTLDVIREGQQLELGGPTPGGVLAMLLIHANRVVTTDQLLEAVWGESGDDLRNRLWVHVSNLRSMLEPGRDRPGSGKVLVTRSNGYLLKLDGHALDSAQFERRAAQGRSLLDADPEQAVRILREALGTWRGRAYEDFTYRDFAQDEIRRLQELRIGALEDRIEADLRRGKATDVVSELDALCVEHPLRERLRALHMLALYRSGRQAEALQVYRRTRRHFVDDLGIDPSPELATLQERILTQDPALALPTPLSGQGFVGGVRGHVFRPEPSGRSARGYLLGERLGSGRDGTVHAARLPGVERDLVIREVPAEVADRPDVVRSFDSQMRRVAGLHHEAIVPIDDHWREPGGAWVVLRRMRGGTLRDRLDDGGLASAEVVDLAGRVGSALEAASEVGIVHGRLIPESVLFDESGTVYLADFPIGEVDAEPGDDVVAWAKLVKDLLAGDTAPGAAVLTRALSADVVPPIGELVAAFERAVGVAPGPSAPAVNPYKGLRAFDESDAADFFGRGPLIDELVERLAGDGLAGRLVLVVGASGSGKSSVVRAGLLPRVRAGAVDGSEQWLVTTMVPGARPFKELAEGLATVATAFDGVPEQVSEATPGRQLAPELAAEEDGIDAMLRRILPEDGQLLLVVDQFEELFTLADEELQRAFLDGMMHALAVPDSRLRVVATLRADFYDRPLQFRGFGSVVRDATVTVPAMEAAELEAAIRGPADRVGLQVEDPLVAELVAAVVDQPAAMPSLQFTLYELTNDATDAALGLDAYRQLGGVGGAIASRAESLYQSVEEQQDTVRHVFEQLLVIGTDGELARRPTPRSELASLASDRPIDEVVEPWVQARLLGSDRHPETREPTVEVAHEALLREWPRLRGWIDADRAAIVAAGQLREAAASWESLDRDPGALYRGSKLEATLEQLGRRTEMLPEGAQEFLAASRTARDERREREAERVVEQERTNQRLRRLLTALAVATVVAVVGGLIAFDQRRQARDEAQRAGQAEGIAVARELAAESAAILEEDAELGILLALEAIDRTRAADGTVLPEAEQALHAAVSKSRIVMSVPGLGGVVDWSPDGAVFVTEGPEESGMIDLRDVETGESVRSFRGHDGDVNGVAYSPDGSLLASSGTDGRLRVWDAATGDMEAEFEGDGDVWGATFSPDGSRVAAGWVNEQMVRVFDLATRERRLEVPAGGLRAYPEMVSLSPDGERLAIMEDFVVSVVDVSTGDQLLDIDRFAPGVNRAVEWSPDGRWIAVGSNNGRARIMDADTGERRLTLHGHTNPVVGFDWGPDGKRLATGSDDGTTHVWEVAEDGATEQLGLTAKDTQAGGRGVAFSPDGQRLLTGDAAVSAAKIWDVGFAGGAEWVNLPGAMVHLGDAAFTPDGERLVTTGNGESADGESVVVTDLATGDERTLGVDQGAGWQLAVNPQGDLVAAITKPEPGGPSTVRVWDAASGNEVFSLEEWEEDLSHYELAWSPDGQLLAISGPQVELGRVVPPGKILVLDRTGQQVAEIVMDGDFIPVEVEFGPDGERLAATRLRDRADPTHDNIRVWDWATGEVLLTLPAEGAWGNVTFDPGGTRIVAPVLGGVRVWDANTGEPLMTFSGHKGEVYHATFSPDGDTVASGGTNGDVRLWSAETGVEQLVLHGHNGPAADVAFSPEGDRLVSAGPEVVRVWALDLDDLVDIAEDRLTRSFTDDECRQYLHVDACPE